MKFNPLSKQEIQELGVIPPGEYDYQVIEAENAVSKSGNEMIKLKLRIWMPNGSERVLMDYLMEAMAFKLSNFCEYNGIYDLYQSGELTADDCLGKSGKLFIRNDKSDQYGLQHKVANYLAPPASEISNKIPTKTAKDDFIDDSLPF